ncbi:MAG: dTDP-glucose 4,6-dehydratase [candidate division Zixibacteria bacterium SM23_81]|nr:MAG: dTDP-glucose 4,6-dehydratase [candidate division Zixibacteria bacterium SM23_81]
MHKILITGGAGFIGSNFVKYMLAEHPEAELIVLDKLTYAGNLDNLKEVWDDARFTFVKGDICDGQVVEKSMSGCDAVINFAAETHVDRSIGDAGAFVRTDVYGTHVLLEAVRKLKVRRYIQISTDEVYGSVGQGSSREGDPLNPSSPYAASKAGADLLVLSYYVTHSLPVLITRSSNNFGSNQYPEKLIPLFVTNALENISLPLYGDGLNVRDWLYVRDNCRAIDLVLQRGEVGEIYNVGGDNEKSNREITDLILRILDKPKSLVKMVRDRPGHDRRYSVNSEKLKDLGWAPKARFEDDLERTVQWYEENEDWWRKIKEGRKDFQEYYKRQYGIE